MARVANSMVTFQDLDDMVTFEGFSYVTNPITPPSNLNTCATKLDVLGYIDANLSRNTADNQLVSYSIIVPPAITDELSLQSYSSTQVNNPGTYYQELFSNTSWTGSSDSSWLTLSEDSKSGVGDQRIFMSLSRNDSFSRTGIITFTTGQVTVTHTVTQEGANSGTKNF